MSVNNRTTFLEQLEVFLRQFGLACGRVTAEPLALVAQPLARAFTARADRLAMEIVALDSQFPGWRDVGAGA